MTRTRWPDHVGTHDHAEPPPLRYGGGCRSCDELALFWSHGDREFRWSRLERFGGIGPAECVVCHEHGRPMDHEPHL